MNPIKLNDVKTPTFELELPDGSKKSFDLYELNERLNGLKSATDSDGNLDVAAQYDAMRRVFEFPSAAEAEKSSAFTLSRAQCEYLQTEVLERVANLPEKKRFFALLRKLSDSTASA